MQRLLHRQIFLFHRDQRLRGMFCGAVLYFHRDQRLHGMSCGTVLEHGGGGERVFSLRCGYLYLQQ